MLTSREAVSIYIEILPSGSASRLRAGEPGMVVDAPKSLTKV